MWCLRQSDGWLLRMEFSIGTRPCRLIAFDAGSYRCARITPQSARDGEQTWLCPEKIGECVSEVAGPVWCTAEMNKELHIYARVLRWGRGE